MKRITFLALIAIITLASINVDGKTRKVKSNNSSISYEKLVSTLAKGRHWNEKNLVKLGLKKLLKKTSKEEYGTEEWFIYGKNTTATANNDWTANLTSTGAHAFAIEVTLTTDNGTSLYFKEKADHDAFMSCARNSKYYEHNDESENIGCSFIQSYEYVNGWYVISIHVD